MNHFFHRSGWHYDCKLTTSACSQERDAQTTERPTQTRRTRNRMMEFRKGRRPKRAQTLLHWSEKMGPVLLLLVATRGSGFRGHWVLRIPLVTSYRPGQGTENRTVRTIHLCSHMDQGSEFRHIMIWRFWPCIEFGQWLADLAARSCSCLSTWRRGN